MHTRHLPPDCDHPLRDLATATAEQVKAAPAGALAVIDDAHYVTDWGPVEASKARLVMACLPTPAAAAACDVVARRGGVVLFRESAHDLP